MAQKYRNHKGKDDQMIKLCAGLWNFHIQNSYLIEIITKLSSDNYNYRSPTTIITEF